VPGDLEFTVGNRPVRRSHTMRLDERLLAGRRERSPRVLQEVAGRSADQVPGRKRLLDHLTLIVVQAFELQNDTAAVDGSALQDLVVLASAICIEDRIAAPDAFDRDSVGVAGRQRHIDEGKRRT
jgi:hypothetical protein